MILSIHDFIFWKKKIIILIYCFHSIIVSAPFLSPLSPLSSSFLLCPLPLLLSPPCLCLLSVRITFSLSLSLPLYLSVVLYLFNLFVNLLRINPLFLNSLYPKSSNKEAHSKPVSRRRTGLLGLISKQTLAVFTRTYPRVRGWDREAFVYNLSQCPDIICVIFCEEPLCSISVIFPNSFIKHLSASVQED